MLKKIKIFVILLLIILVSFSIYSNEKGKIISIYKNIKSESVSLYGEPSASWIIDSEYALNYIGDLLKSETKKGEAFLLVQYIIPGRDRGGLAKGGADSEKKYISTVDKIADLIGSRLSIMIVEPDELGFGISQAHLIKKAVEIYRKKCANIKIFIDAGNPKWLSAEEASARLKMSGIESADGFSINVSSFYSTEDCLKYGDLIVKELNMDKKYEVDTSRNGGRNPVYPDIFDPAGIATGQKPCFNTNNKNCYAFLWIKPPGESDGRVARPGEFKKGLVEKK
jgi:endoglucanase